MRRSYLIAVGLGLAAGIALAIHPFTRAIDYPQALLLAPFAALFALVRAVWRDAPADQPLAVTWGQGLPEPALFCATALVPPAVASLAVDVCDPLTGLLFHLAGPWAAAAAAAAVGTAIAALPLRRGWRLALGVLVVLLSPAVPTVEFFTGPSVRFYTTFFGLYHGAIYDEAVFVEPAYAWFRLWNALGLVALLVGIDGLRGRLPRWSLAPAAAAGLVWLALLHPALNPGFMMTTATLDRRLPPAATCEHFVIHARPGGPAETLAEAACRDLEFRLARQTEVLGLTPSRTYHAYLYDSPRHKAALMGAGRASIARPWQGQLHIAFTGVGTRLTAHELAHLYSGEAAPGTLAIPVSYGILPIVGLIEGVAVALEPPRLLAPLHDHAAAIRRLGIAPSMASLMEPSGFWSHAGGKAYTLAGSFVRWLLETHGADAVTALYGGATFEDAIGASLETLEAEWIAALDARPLSAEVIELAAFIFDRPSVFQKRCPYAVARCNSTAMDLLAHQGPDEALPLIRRALAYDPGRLSGIRFLARLLAATGDGDAAREVLTRTDERKDFSKVQAASVLLTQADVFLFEGRGGDALQVLDALTGPAVRLWGAAISERAWLTGATALDKAVLPGLLGLASRSRRRAQIRRLLGSSDRGVVCLALARALRSPGPWDLEDRAADRCLAVLPPGCLIACRVALAARWDAWVRDQPTTALRWQEVVENDCLETIGIRPDEAEDWRLRLEWESVKKSGLKRSSTVPQGRNRG